MVFLLRAAYLGASGGSTVPPLLSLLCSFILFPLAGFLVLRVVGDAARYLHVSPTNIHARHEIRQLGVDLLKELHKPEHSYSRIVVVGHSLGSVIGYDILTHAWINYHDHTETAPSAPRPMEALDNLESLAAEATKDTERVQSAQRLYFEELKTNGCGWLVSDFVTLGSPLAHASILLARDSTDLQRKQEDRELPTCLPTLESAVRDGKTVKRFSFEVGRGRRDEHRLPHHAAVFAPTRWTNLFFPSTAIFWGDPVGGPLKAAMGLGVRDVPVRTSQNAGLFSHTRYWSQAKQTTDATHIAALRDALDLSDRKGLNK